MAKNQSQYDSARQIDEYGNSVGQKDKYGNPVGHHTGTTGGEYSPVGYETATTGAGKYGGSTVDPDRQTDEYGKPVGRRAEHGNPIGHHTRTTGEQYGTVGYENATTGAGKYGGNPVDPDRQTGEYGKPVGPREEYGNPIGHRTSTTGGAYGTGGYETTATGAGKYGGAPGSGRDIGGEYNKEQHGKLSRSGSSSSEDDGQGGRRKKGIKEKIKQKLPGTRKDDDPSYVTSTTPGGYHSEEQPHEKKGIMDKIKEKLPGHHDDQ